MSTSTLPTFRWLPWRSTTFGWIVAGLALIVGVPLFLCMPPWADVTLYDLAARNVLRGGVYYRDIFDTNLPGVVWVMAAVRLVFGWSYEVLRAFDLLVIAVEVWLLLGWVRKAGGTPYSIAWLAASFALFYPFTSEFCHMQRDPWLLLPALIAARMRLARVERAGIEHGSFARAFLEGSIWGAAVWVKPHVVFPAFALWIVSALLIARREHGRQLWRELGGLILGGLLVGAVGVAWLIGTGAWPYFLDVFLNWNPNYMNGVVDEAGTRFVEIAEVFPPWGLLHFVAMPLAVLAVCETLMWARRRGKPAQVAGSQWIYAFAETESIANARAMLAVFYLVWLAQAVILQKGFEYIHVPVMFLGMAVIATQRWAFGFVYLVWFAFLAVLLNATDIVPTWLYPPPGFNTVRLEHAPFTDPEILRLWPRCWREGGSPELRDKLGHFANIPSSTNWEELTDVAEFLKTIDPPLGPGELNCWVDSTHPLYLMLDLEPATRYMHYGTAFHIASQGNWIKKQINKEVAESRQHYVVSDIARMEFDMKHQPPVKVFGDEKQMAQLNAASPWATFPKNQPIVFRSGRYVVHKIENPIGRINVP